MRFMMKVRVQAVTILVPAICALALAQMAAGPAAAQIPDEFTNLKLLDPGIEKPQLIGTMRDWAMGLGVRCNHCHVGPDNLQGMDFASDEKATKRTARRMLEMSRAINGELMADLPIVDQGDDHQTVSCYTCHRGQATPPRMLANQLADVARESGPEAAIDEYRALREEHELAGRYDFRETTLSSLSRMYAGARDFDNALAVVDGAKEFFGDSPSLFTSEGMVKFGAQDLNGAQASFQKALALDPEFEPAKRALAQLTEMMAREGEGGAAESGPDQ